MENLKENNTLNSAILAITLISVDVGSTVHVITRKPTYYFLIYHPDIRNI